MRRKSENITVGETERERIVEIDKEMDDLLGFFYGLVEHFYGTMECCFFGTPNIVMRPSEVNTNVIICERRISLSAKKKSQFAPNDGILESRLPLRDDT